MIKRYQLSGSLSFQIVPGVSRWIDPTGGGFIEEEIEPAREAWLTAAGFIKEVVPPAKKEKAKE